MTLKRVLRFLQTGDKEFLQVRTDEATDIKEFQHQTDPRISFKTGRLPDGSVEPVEVLRKDMDLDTAVDQAISAESKIQNKECDHCQPPKTFKAAVLPPIFKRPTLRGFFLGKKFIE